MGISMNLFLSVDWIMHKVLPVRRALCMTFVISEDCLWTDWSKKWRRDGSWILAVSRESSRTLRGEGGGNCYLKYCARNNIPAWNTSGIRGISGLIPVGWKSGKRQGKRNGHWKSWKSQGNLIWVRKKWLVVACLNFSYFYHILFFTTCCNV